ncbi:hypothetical protein D6C95_10500, partial [Aureobasidium pullulans]
MPDINDLPTELMVETFSHLELGDLTRCMRSSKTFKAITEHSAFDKIFFRTKTILSNDLIDLNELENNPVLERLTIHYLCEHPIEDAEVSLNTGDSTKWRSLPLIESSAAKQNTTEPSVTRITLRPYIFLGREDDHSFDVEVKAEQGITVLDVMKGLCAYYLVPDMLHDERHCFFEGFY